MEEEAEHGVSIKPVAFLIIKGENVKLLPVEHNCTIDKLIDYIPELFEKSEKLVNKIMENNDKEGYIQKPKIKKVNENYKFDYNKEDE